jgi:hypothetical protein
MEKKRALQAIRTHDLAVAFAPHFCTTLHYRSFVMVEDLLVGECTIRPCAGERGDFWHMWFRVARKSDGAPDTFCVPVAPNGGFTDAGPGGLTWGLAWGGGEDPGAWQVSPSINVLDTREPHPGVHPTLQSLWHETPCIRAVPLGERWSKEAP